MKKKIAMMSILCLALTTEAIGQENAKDSLYTEPSSTADVMLQPIQPEYLDNTCEGAGWDRNWFIEVKGGASAFMGSPLGCGDVFDRVTPVFQAGVGKWFTPSIGGRVEFQGFQFKNAELATMKYQFIHADFMYNLTAFFRQNEIGLSRWDVIPFVGVGMAHNTDWRSSCDGTGHASGSHPFAFSYGLEARYRINDRLHIVGELSGLTTMKNFDAIGTSSKFGDHMLSLSAGLSLTLGKTGYKRVVDARPYISQNEWLMEYSRTLSSHNQQLSRQVREDGQCIKEYRKILEIEGLLELYKDRIRADDHEPTKNLYPRNDYSGLNSLRARLINRGWNGNPATMPNAVQKREDLEDAEDTGETDTSTDINDMAQDYLAAMTDGKAYIGAPIYFFFHVATDHLTDLNQVLNVDEIAKVAKTHRLKVRIVGSADNATGTETINRQLSRKRAEYICQLLKDRGVEKNNISTVFEGGTDAYSPIEANRNTCVYLSF